MSIKRIALSSNPNRGLVYCPKCNLVIHASQCEKGDFIMFVEFISKRNEKINVM